ncbi:hypothetical protein [Spirochaeta africana]|uniref:Uncharacterized protein n=1 Tax=Spirochaeta africana (strain ATCC 700263 / DSM 8902 / Z-7692) TaxID=889378 RepID=H9UFL6_SPIAZ|nr:hypothetical protein [Spirochaeta africana]AFG36309.1 hypothetical protein Spiaf_0200 [Spirochaeta africana DSM 8902]
MKHGMKREDFIFTIGYSGMTAVVDAAGRKRYGKLTPDQLLEKGLYRSAFAAAVYDDDQERLQRFVGDFREKTSIQVESVDQVRRLFGVYTVPQGISRVILV